MKRCTGIPLILAFLATTTGWAQKTPRPAVLVLSKQASQVENLEV
jgi:hypothetical protein